MGGNSHVRYVLPEVPRGRYRFDAVRAVFEDPFGLAHAEQDLGAEFDVARLSAAR